MNNKISKDIVPDDFSLSLAIVDFFPCLFFLLTSIVLGLSLSSIIFIIGSIITFISGLIKVIWKLIVVFKKKNVWILFIQMRIVMPIGFIIMMVGFIVSCFNIDLGTFFQSLLNSYSLVFLILGLIGMVLMIICAIKLDSSDKKSNWIEQCINTISQLCFFLGFLLAYLLK